MFNNFKKKFNTALQEASIITENLQQQYRQRIAGPDANLNSSSRSSLAASNLDLGFPSYVNAAAGCTLLAKYEEDWKIIHENNVENSQIAKKVAQQIHIIENRITNHHLVITDLLHCLSALPNLVAKLKTCQDTLGNVHQLCEIVNAEFEKLEDACEECELQDYIFEKQCEISKYKQKKLDNLETYRQKIAAEHQQRIEHHDNKLKTMQKERQAVFHDAFRKDLEEFKQKGHLPSKFAFIIPILSEIHTTLSEEITLEEVVLDDTESTDALEDFLNG